MAKTFNAFEKVTIKNTAKEVARLAAKQEKLREQVKLYAVKIEADIKEIDDTIAQYEENIQKMTGGYAASELCEKVNDIWVFKYPDTIVPVTELTKEEPKENKEEERVEKKEEEKEEPIVSGDKPENQEQEVDLTGIPSEEVPDFEDPFEQPENPFEEDPSNDDDFFHENEF